MVNTKGWVNSPNYYNTTSLANVYCYNEQLVGGEDLDPFVVSISNAYVTIRAEGYSMRTIMFTISSIHPSVFHPGYILAV